VPVEELRGRRDEAPTEIAVVVGAAGTGGAGHEVFYSAHVDIVNIPMLTLLSSRPRKARGKED
jgi:hypothetical protein